MVMWVWVWAAVEAVVEIEPSYSESRWQNIRHRTGGYPVIARCDCHPGPEYVADHLPSAGNIHLQ